MKTLGLKIAAALLISLGFINPFDSNPGQVFLTTFWQVEEIRGEETYYIHWKVEANTDSLQFIYYCGDDTTYSDIKKSTNQNFSDTHRSRCNAKTKVVIDPFLEDGRHVEVIDIPFIKSLPDTL
ncbi:MAG: hypothetical protein R3222_01385 [Balneolaceae bacterium]|nr:hypothetical protein [Balneolaceae bacterium]